MPARLTGIAIAAGVVLAGIASAGVYMLTQGALSGIVVIAAAISGVVIVGRILEETIRNSA